MRRTTSEAPMPPDEATRLGSLRALGVLFTPAEERFERITRLAARLLHVPMALISLVDARIQWFKAAHGVRVSQTPREISFCTHAILGDDTLVVPDALADARFRDSPLVRGAPFIRAYAGHPLRAPDGGKVGTLCVMDTRPRRFDEGDLETLRYLAVWVEDELQVQALSDSQTTLIAERDEARRRALLDPLTRAWNRDAILEVLGRELARAGRDGTLLSVIMADVDHFKRINDSFGHSAGDAVLLGVVASLRATLRPYDAVGRYGGEEFLVVLPRCDGAAARTIAERMRRRVERERFATGAGVVRATLSLGVSTAPPAPTPEPHAAPAAASTPQDLLAAADRALYRAKSEGRNRVVAAA